MVSRVMFLSKQKTAYEMRISGWSSDVCSSDLTPQIVRQVGVHLFIDRARPRRQTARMGMDESDRELSGLRQLRDSPQVGMIDPNIAVPPADLADLWSD